MNQDKFIERHILIGLITSTEYLHEVHETWNKKFLKSKVAQELSEWCLQHYKKYRTAPGADIEGIYFEKLRKGEIDQDFAEEIEEDILPDLSEEYERAEKFNVQYLLDRTRSYFSERNMETYAEEIQDFLDAGDIEKAEQLAARYRPVETTSSSDIDLSDPESLMRIEQAFGEKTQPILELPGAVGEFMNPQLTRDALVSFLAPEKRGKSFMMLDIARRGVRQRLNVAFFQAGDMSESQQIRRLGIHLAKRSDLPQYTGTIWEPVKDCIKNQVDTCDLAIRERHLGLEGEHAPMTENEARDLTFAQLRDLYKENSDYRNCHNCKEYHTKNWGVPWMSKVNLGGPLQTNEAVKIFRDYFVKNKRSFMLSTHANNTLTVPKMNAILDQWYRKGFVADLIVVDYADLLDDETSQDFRQKQNNIWKGLRSLSQERHALVLTATQADAKSYETGLLKLSNFSEDKRKYAHVTAFYGLNQDPNGREKDIGIMRINELLVRENPNEYHKTVTVLQNLKRGQPILTSYW